MIELPEGWIETTLGESAIIKGGKRLPKGCALVTYKTNHPYIRITDLENNAVKKNQLQFITDDIFLKISKYIVNSGDVILSIVGTIGLVATIDDELDKANLTENCVKFINLNNVNSNFLYYFLSSRIGRHEINKNTVGAVQKKLPIYGIKNIKIDTPSLPEQKSIANILSSFDEKIELLREQNETLEILAQTIFKEWFVNFNYPDATGEVVGSELGEIPKGWRVGQLNEQVKITMGQSPKGDSYNELSDGMVFYQGRAEFQRRFPQRRLHTTEPKRIAEKFDVLMSVRAPVGDINVATEQCCIGRGLAAINSEHKSYALYRMKSLKKEFDKFESEGTVFGSINKNSLEGIKVIIPLQDIIERYNLIAGALDEKIYQNFSQIQALTKTRDTLLPKLMSGEIRVSI